jgi:hypothetical protein
MEARIFANNFTKFGDKRVDPVDSINFGNVTDSFNGHTSNCWDSIFKIVKEERLKIFSK